MKNLNDLRKLSLHRNFYKGHKATLRIENEYVNT